MPQGTALLIIDAQVNMFAKEKPVHEAGQILWILGDLARKARVMAVPVFYLRNCGRPGDPDDPGSPGWEIHSAVSPHPTDEVIDKSKPDSFEGTSLQAKLEGKRVSSLVVAGMQSELCVQATCRRAVELGYDVTLVADGHTTFDTESTCAEDLVASTNHKLAQVTRLVNAAEIHFT